MALLEFFGCAFIAFGPPIVMFILTIAKDPIRVIILIARSVMFALRWSLFSFTRFILNNK